MVHKNIGKKPDGGQGSVLSFRWQLLNGYLMSVGVSAIPSKIWCRIILYLSEQVPFTPKFDEGNFAFGRASASGYKRDYHNSCVV